MPGKIDHVFQVIKPIAGMNLTAARYQAVAGSLLEFTHVIEEGTNAIGNMACYG